MLIALGLDMIMSTIMLTCTDHDSGTHAWNRFTIATAIIIIFKFDMDS